MRPLAVSTSRPHIPSTSAPRWLKPNLPRHLFVTAFALLIFASKLALIHTAGTDVPQMDQWDAEAHHTLVPWLEHRLTSADLLYPHNEHRLVTTKLWSLAFVAANGQWSGFVTLIANAAVHTAFAVGFLLLSRRWLTGPPFFAFAALLLLLHALPFSWENTLGAFQIQFYFLLLFSFGHLAFTLGSSGSSIRWLIGQLCATLALFTLASGLLSSAALLCALAAEFLRTRRLTGQQLVSAALALAFLVLGWSLRNVVPGHAPLHAQSLGEFLLALLQLLTWPAPLWLPLVLVPTLLFVLRLLRDRDQPPDLLLVGLLAWTLLQLAALAYARGTQSVTSSRYFDLLVVHVALAFIFLATLPNFRFRRAALATWFIVTALALAHVARDQWHGIILPRAAQFATQQENLRRYLATHDPQHLAGKSFPDLPYPDSNVLLQRLSSPALRSLLPPSIRAPLDLSPTSTLTDGGAVPPPRNAPPRTVPPSLLPSPFPIALSTFSLTSSDPFTWQSATQPDSTLPFVRFRLAGDLGRPETRLALSIQTRTADIPIVPDSVPGERWKNVTILRPDGPWWIAVNDSDPDAWFAVAEPVELGRLTWLAEKILKHHFAFAAAGLVFLLLGIVLHLLSRRASVRL